AAAVFLDALLPLLAGGATLGSPSPLVAAGSWVSLLYPALVLVATRPFREPLSFRPRAIPTAPGTAPAAAPEP
ncbi:MAG TPA: hypothetical protein VHI93_01690, partial [Candidatus Thermoplasmatota archaeon]|nr:hypothetical protein [Candidatus Thermoplasmatota archaeon]